MKMTELFTTWETQFAALERLVMLSPEFDLCENHRVYLGWTDVQSFECNIPKFDTALARRIVAAFPGLKWERREETFRIIYIGTADGLQIQLHYAEPIPASKQPVITPLKLEAE